MPGRVKKGRNMKTVVQLERLRSGLARLFLGVIQTESEAVASLGAQTAK